MDLGVTTSATSSYTLGTGTGYTYTMPLDNAYLESHDHLGNVRTVMDGAGNIVSYSNYYAFGSLGIKR